MIYPCRIALLAVDAADDYWVLRHQIVHAWQNLETLLHDEEALAACWAFEQDYLGVEIAGTVHNELRVGGPLEFPGTGHPTRGMPRAVGQHEPSGGGRSTPQHRRVTARAAPAGNVNRTEQRTTGVLRRTRIRRSRHEITSVGLLIAAECLDMVGWPTIYPSPGAHCGHATSTRPVGLPPRGPTPDRCWQPLPIGPGQIRQAAAGPVRLGLGPRCRAAPMMSRNAYRATCPGRCRAPGPSA
jgi:hypothetical protein